MVVVGKPQEGPLVALDLILTLSRFPTEDAILGHIHEAPILASCIVDNHQLIWDPQVLCSHSVYRVGGSQRHYMGIRSAIHSPASSSS